MNIQKIKMKNLSSFYNFIVHFDNHLFIELKNDIRTYKTHNISSYFEESETKPKQSILSTMEMVNNNLPQLFWKTLDQKKENKPFLHGIIFIFIILFIIYPTPYLFEKIRNLTKSSVVIDDILDVATEDLTMTMTKTNHNNKKSKKEDNDKLNTIVEENSNIDTADQFDNIDKITQNIINEYTKDKNEKFIFLL